MEPELKLRYENYSTDWMNGLPIGNGRLAAMLRCGQDKDILSLNHEWLWRANNRQRDNEPVAEHLGQVRRLLEKGDYFTATTLANCWFGGRGGISQLPGRVDAYQPAGDLVFLLSGEPEFVQRELDLRQGFASCQRLLATTAVKASFFASLPHNRIICSWQSNEKFSGRLSFARIADPDLASSCQYSSRGIEFNGVFAEGLAYRVTIELFCDGLVRTDADSLWLEGARQVLLVVNLATSVKGIEEELAAWPASFSLADWPGLLLAQQREFSVYMDRFKISLGQEDKPLPTDQRIEKLREGGQDENLLLLLAQYGRYLLLATSLGADLPANLQGKWNEELKPPWDCDYHLDVNLQMNYWAVHSANLAECARPLFSYVRRLHRHGVKAARDLYGCGGTWLPIQTDAWARATPESFGWSVWIGAGAWLAWHFWQHFQYSGDQDFLAANYPFFRDVADFYLDYCIEDSQGVWQILPSQSPENRFAGTGLWPVSIGVSAAMDVQLAFDALGYAIESARILQKDEEKIKSWQQLRDKLPPFGIGGDGRLLEWNGELEEVEPGHRHLSHLYGLYPAELFNPLERPSHYRAALASLDHRLDQGGGHTGWSRAWVACLMARAGRGGQFREHLQGLITDFATQSLLDLHPPRIFQIDGNLGATAALIEALAQFWQGRLHLLRALPPQWENGFLQGLCVPGGHKVSFSWKKSRLEKLSVEIGYNGRLLVQYGQSAELALSGQPGEIIKLVDPFPG